MAISEEPLIYSFANMDARFYGIHASMEVTLLERVNESKGSIAEKSLSEKWTLSLAVSKTRGKDVQNGKGLPEVPPLEANAGLKYYGTSHLRLIKSYWITLMCRHVVAHDNPQPDINPVFKDTDSYTLMDLEIHAKLTDIWTLNLRIANLLDEEAYSYLQPPVATGPIGPSSGTLVGGDRVPLPGRNVQISLGFSF